EKKLSTSNMDSYKSDIYASIKILKDNLQSVPSKLRLVVEELSLDIIKTKNYLSTSQIDEINFIFWKLEILNRFSSEIKEVCDCSFFYWYKDIIPDCLNHIYSNVTEFKRIYFFSFAVSNIDNLLSYNK